MNAKPPKLFISYSWSSPEHEDWVLELATALRDNGVDVILDKWDLREGHDPHTFMESMVTNPEIEKVAMICDRAYAEKADGRTGGVGTEAQIISKKVYESVDQTKFVAVIAEVDDNGRRFVPTFYGGRIYIDLSDEESYATNFEQLLRWIFDKPLYLKPEIGHAPTFVEEGGALQLGTTGKIVLALDAVRKQRPSAGGLVQQALKTFSANLERFRIAASADIALDEQVVQSIRDFLPYRDQLTGLFLALAQYEDTDRVGSDLHRFFETLIPYIEPPEEYSPARNLTDNFSFVVHEAFLYLIASLLRHERFGLALKMLRTPYYRRRAAGGGNAVRFVHFRKHLETFDDRKRRLNLSRASLHADMLLERSKGSGFHFDELMQADLVLYLRDCLDVLREGGRQQWWPETLLYSSRVRGPFEIFARSESRSYFANVASLLDILDKNQLEAVLAAENLMTPHWDFCEPDIAGFVGIQSLAERP